MPTDPAIQLPTLGADETDYRSLIENHVKDVLIDAHSPNIRVVKYYKTANEQIYQDCKNLLESGVPNWLVRTRREDQTEISLVDTQDWKSTRLEIISAVTSRIEKGVLNVDRYVYVMHVLCRELLRKKENRIKLPRNTKRPFLYNGNRDIFRDDDIDILLTEFTVEYINF